MQDTQKNISNRIKQLALEEGFNSCGFTPAVPLSEDSIRLRKWLDRGLHAGMRYMENHFEKRTNPSLLEPGTKSVIVVTLNYFNGTEEEEQDSYILSKYARGRDYHKVMKKMLNKLLARIHSEIVPVQGRAFTDSAPVLERSLAARAGLGWIGKNSNLISPAGGSFFFIGELFVDIELDYGKLLPDRCGGCTKCIQACPTQAITEPGVIDSRRCISYWTIEHKGEIDPSLTGKFRNRIFGCDICQEVCPWNKKSATNKVDDFKPAAWLTGMTKDDWQKLTEEKFGELFTGTAVMRAKYEGLIRNIRFVSDENSKTQITTELASSPKVIF